MIIISQDALAWSFQSVEGSSALLINPPHSFQSAATTLWADQLFCVFDFLPSSLATSSYSLSPTNHNHSSELVNFLAHPASVSHHPLLALWHSMHVHGDDDDGEKDNDGTVTIPEGHLCWMDSRGSRSDYSMHSVTAPPLCSDQRNTTVFLKLGKCKTVLIRMKHISVFYHWNLYFGKISDKNGSPHTLKYLYQSDEKLNTKLDKIWGLK